MSVVEAQLRSKETAVLCVLVVDLTRVGLDFDHSLKPVGLYFDLDHPVRVDNELVFLREL